MMNDLRLSKIFWYIPTVAAFLAALAGILFKDMYDNLFPKDFLPGAFLQDILTMAVCIFLFVIIPSTKKDDFKRQIIITGLLGSFFYLYGIFTIERVYTWFYLLYVIVFSSSFWSIIYSLSGFRSEKFQSLKLSSGLMKTTAISSIVIAIIFTLMWTAALIPIMRDHTRIDYLYSIFILDLCFIMPAFFITAVMSLRKKPFGILMIPAIMEMGFFVIFPLALNELAKPSFGMPINYGPLIVSFVFSFFMLSLGALQLKMMQLQPQ